MSKTGTFLQFPEDQDGKLPKVVTKSTPLPVEIRDSLGQTVDYENPVPVEIALNPIMFNEYAHLHTGVISTLTVATNPAGTDRSVTVADGTIFAIGDHVQISNGTVEPTFALILSKTGADTLNLDRFVDYGHDIGTEVEKVTFEMAVLGTLAAPIEFIAKPEGTAIAHVQRITFSMVHGNAGDMGKFGGMSTLDNGVIIRVRQAGQYRTLTQWKNNDEIKDDMYDVTFNTRAGGTGSYGTSGRWTLERFGVEERLDASTDDRIEVYIQDDLTAATGAGGGLDHFSIKVQGHYL